MNKTAKAKEYLLLYPVTYSLLQERGTLDTTEGLMTDFAAIKTEEKDREIRELTEALDRRRKRIGKSF